MATFCILSAENIIVSTFANSQIPTTQVGYTELSVSGGQVGQLWNGTAFVAGPIPVPQTVTPAQLMMALSAQTYYAAVTAYIATLPIAYQLAFNRVQSFDRQDALINSLAVNVPLTSVQLDALFIAAAAIVP